MKLSKEDWQQLDILLGKVGFCGYYDLVECLQMVITNISPELDNIVKNQSDIQVLVTLLITISKKGK